MAKQISPLTHAVCFRQWSLFRHTAWFLLILAVLPLPVSACVANWLAGQSYVVKGQASTPAGESLYTEVLRHVSGPDGGALNVDYSDSSGMAIATKSVHYNCNPTTPSYELVDLNSGIAEGVKWQHDQAQIYRQGEEDSERLTIPVGASIVDAGFDNAVKIHWDDLVAGITVKFNYLFPNDKRFLRLRFTKTGPPKPLRAEATANTVFFAIAADNTVFRWLSNPVYVGYDRNARQLKYYYGPSNLPMMANQGDVIIRYQRADRG